MVLLFDWLNDWGYEDQPCRTPRGYAQQGWLIGGSGAVGLGVALIVLALIVVVENLPAPRVTDDAVTLAVVDWLAARGTKVDRDGNDGVERILHFVDVDWFAHITPRTTEVRRQDRQFSRSRP